MMVLSKLIPGDSAAAAVTFWKISSLEVTKDLRGSRELTIPTRSQLELQGIWVFPTIMVPPNHPFVHRVFHYKPSILGVLPLFWETTIYFFCKSDLHTDNIHRAYPLKKKLTETPRTNSPRKMHCLVEEWLAAHFSRSMLIGWDTLW